MSIEINIVCDGCSAILVAASSVSEARREAKRHKTAFRLNRKDLCPECYAHELRETVKGNQP